MNIESKTTVFQSENGSYITERIKFKNNDTILERVLVDGKLRTEKQLFRNKRNGRFVEYYQNMNPLVKANYLNDKLHGEFKLFYADGNISHRHNYVLNNLVDTSTFYDSIGNITTMIIYEDKCPAGNSNCNFSTIIFKDGAPAYSFETISGWKQDELTILDQKLYDQIQKEENNLSPFEISKRMFRQYCSPCHNYDSDLVGPALNPIIENITSFEMIDLYLTKEVHDQVKLKSDELEKIIEYIYE